MLDISTDAGRRQHDGMTRLLMVAPFGMNEGPPVAPTPLPVSAIPREAGLSLDELFDVETIVGGKLCRFPITDAPPHRFCAEPADAVGIYCAACHKRTFGGVGKDWQALAGMMAATEQTIRKTSEVEMQRPETPGVDIELAEATL